ncbi:MAG: hypothetical protein M1832_001985 [Thelocarpon impressellum]|nr:MAG: hypothetical protein M1832_001985 [Thelocarpon impressellum]
MAVLCEALYRTFTNAGAMKVPTLLEKVRSFGVEQADLYDETILRLLDRKFDDVAVQVFQDFRQLTTFRPSWELLCSILGTFCRLKDTGNIQKTMKYMDDFYSGPKKHDYGIAMDAFAARGDVDGVESLLGQYFERFGTAYLHIRFLDPLMHAYAKRGESQKAVDLFEQMSGRYGVEPDLRSWNILLEAYGKANDVDGAWQCFNNILDTDLKPNEYTYGTLIGMFANRGDVERVVDLIKLAKEHGEGTAVALYDGLVLAHINNGDVKEAEEVAEQALTMGLKGSLTRMWNYVLRACAFQRKLHEVTRVYQRMQEAGVRFDEKTYGALMQALAMAGQPDLAYKILEKLMPSNGFKPRAFHYAIVMGGYIKNREVHKVFKLFNEMVKQGIKPVMSTSVPLIKAGALTDQLGSPEHGSAGEETTLARAEKILGQVLGSTDVSEIAGEEIHKGMGKRSISEAYPSAYFEFLIFVYGQRRAFVRVKELYDQYLEKSGSRRPAGGVSPPLKMLTALMVAAYRAEDYEEVTRLWRFATEKAEEQARRWKSGGEQWVLPASRHILASPLSYHLKGLEGQGKVDEMKVTVEKMLRDGYELDNKNWNLYIQLLARGGHGVEALELCEARLMPGWKGWRDQRRRLGMKLYKVKADDRTTLRPIYHTLVWLARAVMDMKSEGLGVGERQRPLEEVLRTCPLAMEAIQNMPTEDDPVQASILGRGR